MLIPTAAANALPLASKLTREMKRKNALTTQTKTLKIESPDKLRKPSAISFLKWSTDASQVHSTTVFLGTHERFNLKYS